VNDEKTMRKAGGRNDPYAIFSSRLRSGELPDDWDALIKAAARLGDPEE
jgi:toxin YhaV